MSKLSNLEEFSLLVKDKKFIKQIISILCEKMPEINHENTDIVVFLS